MSKCTTKVFIEYSQGKLVRVVDLEVNPKEDRWLDAAICDVVGGLRNPDATSRYAIYTDDGQVVLPDTHHVRYPAPVSNTYRVTVLDTAYAGVDANRPTLHDLIRSESNWLEWVGFCVFCAMPILGLAALILGGNGVISAGAVGGTCFVAAFMLIPIMIFIECAGKWRVGRIARAINIAHNNLVETHIFEWRHAAKLYQWVSSRSQGMFDCTPGTLALPCWMFGKPSDDLMYYGHFDGYWPWDKHSRVIRGC